MSLPLVNIDINHHRSSWCYEFTTNGSFLYILNAVSTIELISHFEMRAKHATIMSC